MRTLLIVLTLILAALPSSSQESPLPFRGGLIHVPTSLSPLVETHLRTIVANGWAEVTPGDLYHAHLLLKPDAPAEFDSTERLVASTVAILYHSDEMLVRWRLTDGDLPIERRRPRSIIGYRDGTIAPAVTLLPEPTTARDYEWYGSVHTNDLAEAFPSRFARRKNIPVRTGAGFCLVNLQIDIGLGYPPSPTITVSGDRLKITMDCMNPATNPNPQN